MWAQDLMWAKVLSTQHLRSSGMAKSILNAHFAHKAVYGICGGYQIMGTEIRDPHHIEGDIEFIPGLAILPVITTLTENKTTEQRTFKFLDYAQDCKGYEIHMGETIASSSSFLCKLSNNQSDGYFLNSNTWGTYLHGIFDNEVVVNYILKQAGLTKQTKLADYDTFKNEQYDKLAEWVRTHIDMSYVYDTIF